MAGWRATVGIVVLLAAAAGILAVARADTHASVARATGQIRPAPARLSAHARDQLLAVARKNGAYRSRLLRAPLERTDHTCGATATFPGIGNVMSPSIIAHDDTGWVPQGPSGLGFGGSLDRIAASSSCDVWGLGQISHVAGMPVHARVVHFTGSAWELIPRSRYLGNAVLSFLTKIASGYWHVADSQAGYTVLSLRVLRLLDLDRIYTSYGFPNDMFVHLNVWNARVRDFPSRPIYGVGERSGIRIRRVVPRISLLVWKGFCWRLGEK